VHSTRHDDNLAALHASSLPGYVLDVVVLTSDGGLLATLREASNPEHAIWHAPSADAAVDFLVGGRCGILIADLGTLRGDAAGLLARLHSQFPELVLMATGRRDEEASVASLVGDGRIYRFLHKPISPARANLFLGAATRRYFELRNAEPIALTTMKTMARRPRFVQVTAIVVVLAAIGAGLLWFFAGAKAPRTEQPARTSATATAEHIEELLGRANIAYASGDLIEPRGSNALESYRAVLALSPGHPEATAGVERIVAALEEKVIQALEAKDPRAGAESLAALQRVQPDHPRYATLYDELIAISRSQAPLTPRSAPAQPIGPPPTVVRPAPTPEVELPAESQESSAVVEDIAAKPAPTEEAAPSNEQADAYDDALEQLALAVGLRVRGRLIEPAEDNAFDRVLALRTQYPDLREVREEQQRLAQTLIDRARTALAAGALDEAAVLLDKVTQLEPELGVLSSLRAQLQSAQAERESARVLPAGNLKRTRAVDPEYPLDARTRGIEGWVDVEFTITADGTTRDLVVRDSKPKRVFERSALEALRRWRFEPIIRNGEAVEQRAILKLQYELKK
jgi:TonB family protein